MRLFLLWWSGCLRNVFYYKQTKGPHWNALKYLKDRVFRMHGNVTGNAVIDNSQLADHPSFWQHAWQVSARCQKLQHHESLSRHLHVPGSKDHPVHERKAIKWSPFCNRRNFFAGPSIMAKKEVRYNEVRYKEVRYKEAWYKEVQFHLMIFLLLFFFYCPEATLTLH